MRDAQTGASGEVQRGGFPLPNPWPAWIQTEPDIELRKFAQVTMRREVPMSEL